MAATHELLTVSEVADRLRVSTMTVYRLIQREELQALRIGRSYRIQQDALDAFLQSDVVLQEDAQGSAHEEAN